jgi:hypothetical protein
VEVLKLGARIKTVEPRVQIDPALRPGKYRVTLVVNGDRGSSEPAQITLVVRDSPIDPTLRPGPVLTPIRQPRPGRIIR